MSVVKTQGSRRISADRGDSMNVIHGVKSKTLLFINTRLGPLVPLHTRLEGFPRGNSKIRDKELEKLEQVAALKFSSCL